MQKDHDFGFTHTSLEEILQKENVLIKNKLNGLKEQFMLLLDHLKREPDKAIIYWPNRNEKIDAFIKKIDEYIASQ